MPLSINGFTRPFGPSVSTDELAAPACIPGIASKAIELCQTGSHLKRSWNGWRTVHNMHPFQPTQDLLHDVFQAGSHSTYAGSPSRSPSSLSRFCPLAINRPLSTRMSSQVPTTWTYSTRRRAVAGREGLRDRGSCPSRLCRSFRSRSGPSTENPSTACTMNWWQLDECRRTQ